MSVTMWTLLFLGTGCLLVFALLWFVRPAVDQQTVLAMTPWIVTGAAAHALFTVGAYPDQFALLFGPQAVYLTTVIVTGTVWAMMATSTEFERAEGTAAQYLSAAGVGAAVSTTAVVVLQGLGRDLETVLIPVAALVASVAVASLSYIVLNYVYSKAIIETGLLGWLLVLGHVLDGATTAVAVDVEGIPVSYAIGRQIVDFATTLPTNETIGTGWLLVATRLVLALIVVTGVTHLLSRYLKGREQLGYLFVGFVAAFGLGPGVHHLLVLIIT